jgi:fluoride exporter
MNQLVIIAFGGALGAVMRFLVSTGIYQWLGRGFPYGTLTVNIIGSFLMGLLAEALISQRITIALDYRAAILVGFMGAFTTFSTFSLDTFYLLEQGQFNKAALNVAISVGSCLIAVWLGLLFARTLTHLPSDIIPYNILIINLTGALLIGIISAFLLEKNALPIEQRALLFVLIIGAYVLFSSLYAIFLLIERNFNFSIGLPVALTLFAANALLCTGMIALGLWAGKQILFLFSPENA